MTKVKNVIVITGAGGGMGTACIRALARMGELILVDLNDACLDRAKEGADRAGASATLVNCDVTRPADVQRLAEAISSGGAFRALVHTAGISPQMADGKRVLDVDLVGTARVLDAVLPLVRANTAGVCIGSIAGYADFDPTLEAVLDDPLTPTFLDDVERLFGRPLDGDVGYVLAKKGVMRICERLSKEWGAKGGRLVSIAPGLIDTGMGRLELANQEMMSAMAEATPVRRPGASPLPGHPDDIAQLVSFLCSDAASFISGCDVRVDGGLIGASRHMGPTG